MSLKLMSTVWERELPKSPVERFVLVTLADYANDEDNRCWPSVAAICRRTGLSDRTVQRAIRALEVGGFIDVSVGGRDAKTGSKRASVYTFVEPPKGDTRSPSIRSEGDTRSPLRVTHDHPSDPSRVTHRHPEGDAPSPIGCHTVTLEGDTPSPQPSVEPSENRQRTCARPRDLAEVVAFNGTYKVGLPLTECAKFFDHFSANGWRVGRTPMRDWQAALRNWARRAAEFAAPGRKNAAEPAGERGFTTEELIQKGFIAV